MSTFEDRVRRTIEQLQQESFQAMGAQIAQSRMAWLDEHLPNQDLDRFTPRDVYELLFLQQMGLRPEELPIVAESKDEVVWLSYNSCSLLEGCKRLGWDTRQVCRAVNEKATQAFCSRIDPEFRFHRSYTEIRPYAPHCRERIVRVDFCQHMRTAVEEARRAQAEGNTGYGAVVVYEGQVVGQGHDTAATERDPSLHAEVNAIRQAAKTLQRADLCGAILVSTCEPCPMCASLAVWANLTTIVYGVSIEETAQLGRSRIRVPAAEIVQRSPAVVEVVGDVLHDECRALYV